MTLSCVICASASARLRSASRSAPRMRWLARGRGKGRGWRRGWVTNVRHAIALQAVVDDDGARRMRPVISDGCVGCGVCEMICPPEPPAIVIDIDKITEWV